MSARSRVAAALSCLAVLLGAGVAHAAALWDPDYTDSSTFVTQPVGNIGQPVSTGYILNGTQKAYIVDYNVNYWTGDLHSYNLSASGVVSQSDNWSGGAKTQLKNLNAGTGTARNIITNNGNTGIAFRWTSLSATQKTQLDNANAANSTSPILDYIRGDQSNEAPVGTYRTRTFVLGDIIHSTPLVWNDGTNVTVFVGANDGMMHAFDGVTGQERFAYIPSTLIPKLPNLTNPIYYHKHFVDGQFAARKFGSQHILVGTLGRGGKGLFGLDITSAPNSESSAASKVLWEINNTTTNFTNLGHTYGTPQLTVLPDGTNALVVANGYNNTGNGHAVLYLVNPITGTRIAELDTASAGGGGTVSSPNGLSSPTLVDTNFDGRADIAYAGDIDGNLWKFDLATNQVTLLHTTSPAQAITIAPGWKAHPNGGYMVTFGTGRLFTNADETSNATHYIYGIWDRPAAYSTNNTLLDQTLTERTYTGITPNVRVRTATNNTPNWTAGNNKGWRVALPIAGERVVGDGGYVPDIVYLFMSVNPLVNPTSFPPFENWWMQLNALTGGDNGNIIRFDLNGDNQFTTGDMVQVSSVNTAPVGRFMGGGVRSQLTEFSTSAFEIFLANYDVNGDPPVVTINTHGVAGGHFDWDIYYGATTSNGTQATATITVTTTGQSTNYPATLGAIKYGDTIVVPALTTSDIVNGTATATNATTIKNKVVAAAGFTVSLSGSTLTFKAPIGADYNGTSFTVLDGTSQTPLTSTAPSKPSAGTIVITDVQRKQDVSIKCGADTTLPKFTSADKANAWERLDNLYTKMNVTSGGYTTTCTKTADASGHTIQLDCSVQDNANEASLCPGGFTIDPNIVFTQNTGPVGGSATTVYSGWTNFKPALTVVAFSGGTDKVVAGNTCSSCSTKDHQHEYDDVYDRTGVNMLDPSLSTFNIANAITSKSTPFKVLVQNQYLNPAAKLHLHGDPAYQYNVDAGYTEVRNYQTSFSATTPGNLDISTVPSYTLANVGSLAVNLPIDAFTIKNWWGGVNGLPADSRSGLHPTQTGCVNGSAGSTDGNMFEPVIPYGAGDGYTPALTSIPLYGMLGYGNTTAAPWVVPPATSTTAATARGARHNGALVIQIIKASTPQSSIEPVIPGHPEYGFKVKGADYGTYVLVESTTFWHHPNGKCFGVSGWVKDPPPDTSAPTNSSASNLAIAAAHSDPKIGTLGSGGTGVVAGTTTTQTTLPDGTIVTTTTTTTINADGSATTTTTTTYSNGQPTQTSSSTATNTTGGVVDSRGIIGGGVTTPADALGRVNWRELLR